MVSEQTGISVSYKNKHEFSDFWAMSYCFVHIVMLIIIRNAFCFIDQNIRVTLSNFEKGKKQAYREETCLKTVCVVSNAQGKWSFGYLFILQSNAYPRDGGLVFFSHAVEQQSSF